MEEIKVKLVREPKLEYNAVTTPTLAVNMVKDMIGDLDRENFILVNLDNAGKPVNYNVVSIGNEHQTSISISNIMRATILAGSTNIMVFHNHPSGNLNPSEADIAVTNKLIAACKLMDIKLLDHIIVAYNGYYSFKSNNLLNDSLDAYKVKQLLFEEIKEPNFNYGGEQNMKTKGLTKEDALEQLKIINKTIEFNNYINKEARKYMKETGLDKTFNGWHDLATPEMINMMQGFLDEADFMSESTKLKYLEDTSAIFGEKWSIAQNRNLLKDRKDCETFLKTFERAENNAEEENALFRVERNTETTRMNLYFDGKPEEEVRNVLKHNGFKWSPHYSCWTRQLTENAEYSLKRVKEQLKEYIDDIDNPVLDATLLKGFATNNLSIISIKDWYHTKYPTDNLYTEIPQDATFETLREYLNNGKDVYDLLSSDSLVRERAFQQLAELTNVDYNDIYNQWINSNLEQAKHEFISYRDYIKDLPFDPYVDNTKRIKEARENFNRDIKNCDVVLVESRQSYDPEGISSDWVEDNIMYAGDLESVKAKLNEIVENGKNDKNQSVTKFNEDTYQIYYQNAISKVTYTLMDNPLKEKYNLNDMERVTANAEAKGYNVKTFNYVTGNYIAEKQGVIAKYDINGKEQKFTLDELNELKKNAWQRTSDAGSTDKDVEISLFYEKLIDQYNDKFTILKEYPNIDYVLARNNNLEAPEPYVAAHYYNEETKSWGQGHYFTNMDDAFDYLNEVEKDWLKNVDPDALLNTIRDKFNSEEIKTLENSIYNKNDSGKEL